MDDVEALLRDLRTRDPGRPRLTWYGPDGERVELSGKWLDNWAAKTAGLLLEEFDAEPGVRVSIDGTLHWRTVIWTLGTWLTGACVVIGDGGDVVVGQELRDGDDVRLHGDEFLATIDPDEAALEINDHVVAHRDLVPAARAAAPPSRSRVLVGTDVTDPLRTWLPALCTGGSIVIHHDLAGLTPQERAALVEAERITG